MKKQIFVLLAAFLLLTACRSSANTESDYEEIYTIMPGEGIPLALTGEEKARIAQEHMLRRVEAVVSLLDSVSDTRITLSIDSEENRVVSMEVTPVEGASISAEEREGIRQILLGCFSDLPEENIEIAIME